MTGQEIFDITMDLIDEKLDNGSVSESDTASYKAKAPGILTIGQTELSKIGDFFKPFEFSCSPIPNLLGYMANFDMKEFTGEDIVFQVDGAKAYYYEVDGEGAQVIEELITGVWTEIETINVPETVTSFTGYKNVITPSDPNNSIRIRFTGAYYYRIVNVAMYGYNFHPDRIPIYSPWVPVELPDDFKSVDQIIKEHPNRQYTKDSSYKWEGRKTLYRDYYYKGNIRIMYNPIPSPITALSQELVIDDATATTLLPYFLATHLVLEEKDDLAAYFSDRYEELKREYRKKPPASEEPILDVYGGI